MKNKLLKYDYISILAGGSCKFNCSFCIGKDIRENIQPHFSNKWQSFLNCYADRTDLLSVSGDTSDPSFISEYVVIPYEAKQINPNIKVHLHTKDIGICSVSTNISGYDKYILSIDDEFLNELNKFDKTVLKGLQEHSRKGRLRFSIVLMDWNIGLIFGENNLYEQILKLFPNIQITLRPDVNADIEHIKQVLFSFLNDEWIEKNNGSLEYSSNENIWLWNYNKTNPEHNVLYLFSNGNIQNNDAWNI
jgi:hypothetical protein